MFTHFTHKGRQTPYFVVYYEFNEDMTVKEKKKNETKKMIGEIAILLILMGLTFSVLLRDQDLGEVVESVFSVRKRWLIPALLCMGVYIFCGGLCIRVMQHGLGHKMSIARCFKYSFVEFYFSAITPSSTGGQPYAACIYEERRLQRIRILSDSGCDHGDVQARICTAVSGDVCAEL